MQQNSSCSANVHVAVHVAVHVSCGTCRSVEADASDAHFLLQDQRGAPCWHSAEAQQHIDINKRKKKINTNMKIKQTSLFTIKNPKDQRRTRVNSVTKR